MRGVYIYYSYPVKKWRRMCFMRSSRRSLFSVVRCALVSYVPGTVKSIDTRAPKEQQRSSSWQRMVSRTRQCVGLGMSRALLQPAGVCLLVRSSDASIL
jgi:hypothetical protein